jgi:dihydroxy-acid dehydratase
LKKRQAALKLPPPPEGSNRGYAWLFNETILQADEGCDFDFLRCEGKG